ncbi:betaine--homocysteine S-methyltransferase 1-like [Babylonia areolata]|uniref:betaine--homocysteine S-methyltransferase 1-like n=1 Tax=Babylonia areolata TaxID=304850 RepID=UPI003FD2CEC7
MAKRGLKERLSSGEDVLVAEGYLFEFERRGYLKAGAFVPEVVLQHPDLVRGLHEEFVHAGSDVVLAFTYYGHREKLRLTGMEDRLEALNVDALRLAREVADRTGTLMAGNICNSSVYRRDDPATIEATRAMFKEQIEWAVQERADFIVAETFSELGEAKMALDCIRTYGQGLPAVVTFAPTVTNLLYDGVPIGEACRQLEEGGADVVGINCLRGPSTILPLMEEVRRACKGPIACLPVPYRTSQQDPTFQSIRDPHTGTRAFPIDLPAHMCSRTQVAEFARACRELGVQYVGLCCGNCSHLMRVVAEEYGRKPPASKYSPDMSQHYVFGDKPGFHKYYTEGLLQAISLNKV